MTAKHFKLKSTCLLLYMKIRRNEITVMQVFQPSNFFESVSLSNHCLCRTQLKCCLDWAATIYNPSDIQQNQSETWDDATVLRLSWASTDYCHNGVWSLCSYTKRWRRIDVLVWWRCDQLKRHLSCVKTATHGMLFPILVEIRSD